MDHLLSKEQPRRKASAKVKDRNRLKSSPHPLRTAPGRSPRALERASRETARTGGIAQLVERQLCKLDAAGSNPAASTIFAVGARAGV